MKSIKDIQDLVDCYGGDFENKEVTLGAKKDKDGKAIPGTGKTKTFRFKRLGFLEFDALRVRSIGRDGRFDPDRHAGNNARLVAATLVDIETNEAVASLDEIEQWKPSLVDALAVAANEVNGDFPEAEDEAAKNSEATQSEGSF